MPLTRRGASLVELVASLTLTGMLAGLTASILNSATLHLRDRSERMGGEHAVRVAAAAVRAAIESLGQDSLGGVDLLVAGAAGFTARVTRAAGVLCSAGPGVLVARAGLDWWHGLREPVSGRDSLLVGTLEQPAWRRFALGAAPVLTRCPDGSGGIALAVAAAPADLAAIGPGSPLRVFEAVELRLYGASSDAWVGQRLLAGAQAIQPLAGPMDPVGLGLSYEARDGAPTWLPGSVAGVQFRLGTLTERAGGVGLVRGAAPRADSLIVYVALPNAP